MNAMILENALRFLMVDLMNADGQFPQIPKNAPCKLQAISLQYWTISYNLFPPSSIFLLSSQFSHSPNMENFVQMGRLATAG